MQYQEVLTLQQVKADIALLKSALQDKLTICHSVWKYMVGLFLFILGEKVYFSTSYFRSTSHILE